MEYLLILTNSDDMGVLESIAYELLTQKLAACVNIIPSVKSLYRWEGQIESACEHQALIKAPGQNFPTIEQTIKKLHNYDVPEIIATNITNGSKEYLTWLQENSLLQ